MASFLNICRFNPTAGGTTDWTYSSPVTGYQSPAAAQAVNGASYSYRAESNDLSQWEVGVGVYNAGVLTRATVLSNSSGTTAKINFSTVPQVAIVALAEDLVSGKKNYIVNGGMQVSQERGALASATADTYPVDQFTVGWSHGGTVSHAQSPNRTPGGSPFRLRVVVTTADTAVAAGDLLYVRQKIEGLRVVDLGFGSSAAKTIVLRFGVRAPAGTYCVAIRNSLVNRSYVAEYAITATEANTDVVKSVALVADTAGTWGANNNVGLDIVWMLMGGSNFQTGSPGAWAANATLCTPSQFNLMGTVNNEFHLFDVGLYEGAVAPAFAVPDFASELALCRRYYEKSYDYDVSVAAPTLSGAMGFFCANVGAGTHQAGMFTRFQAEKRALPTVKSYSPNTGIIDRLYDAVANADVVATVDAVGTNSFRALGTGASSSTVALYWHWTADARM